MACKFYVEPWARGCEPLTGCFPEWSFFFLRRLSLRGMFRLFYAAYKGAVLNKSKFFTETKGLNTTQRDGDFYGNHRPELEPEKDGNYLCSSKKRNCEGLEKENETATFRKRKQPKNRRIGYIQETICTRFRVFGYTYPLICTQNNTAERYRFKTRWQMWMVFGENACILRNTNLFMPT